jgi:hypothetical protein
MSNDKSDIDEGHISSVTTTAAKAIGGSFVDALVTSAGKVAAEVTIEIISAFGRKSVSYYINRNQEEVNSKILEFEQQSGKKIPPFMVIGLGRCGSHITSILAEIVGSAFEFPKGENTNDDIKSEEVERKSAGGWLSLFNRRKITDPNSQAILIEPLMIVGDVDETTFGDISRLLDNNKSVQRNGMFRVDYRPLAWGGVGNIPIFAEFLTRGLTSQQMSLT